MADWIRYFESEIPPTNLEETRKTLYQFTASHVQNARNVVFITSGGTTVPLETNTVRFIDNFSSGSRGAASAEYFLSQGYAVIFVYRQKSALPFQRYFITQNPLEFLNVNDLDNPLVKGISVNESKAPGLKDILIQYREVKRNGTLLQIEFTTLSSYLFLLRMSAETLSAFGHRIMFYLAAAVSDFYVPRENLSTHKIQSSEGPLVLNLQQTPKLLQPLVKQWSPQAFVVSFKLETDVNIISKKARESLNRNSHQVVISNILQTRRKTVVIVTASEENAIWMSDSELEQGKDIEQKIVADLVRKHGDFVRNNSLPGFSSSNELSLDKSFPIATSSGQVIYLSEGTTYQLQGRVAENPASTILLGPNQTQQFAIPSAYGARKATEDNTANRPLQTEVSELDTLSTTATNLASKFKFTYDNSALSEDMKAFIEMFKNKRMTLGYTQEDVGLELSQSSGPTYSQSFISRFESKQLASKASEKMRPILQAWLDAKDVDQTTGVRLCKKRRRRTSFTSDSLAVLVENYQKNPKPNTSEIAEIAAQLNIEPVTVKVWFCNRKQSERRRSQGRIKTGETLKSELEARSASKEQEKSDGEQITSYSLQRLQPLMAEQGTPPVTVLDTDQSHVVHYQEGVTVATHDSSSTSLTQNTSRSYSSPVTVMDTDPNVVQYQPGTTSVAHNTALNQAPPYSAPVAVLETEVPTSDTVQSTTVVK